MLKTITPIILINAHKPVLNPICTAQKPLAFNHCASPHSLLQETLLQFSPLANPILIAPEHLHKAIEKQCHDIDITPEQICTSTKSIKKQNAQIYLECPCGFILHDKSDFIKSCLQNPAPTLSAQADYIDSKTAYLLLWCKRKFFSARKIDTIKKKRKKKI